MSESTGMGEEQQVRERAGQRALFRMVLIVVVVLVVGAWIGGLTSGRDGVRSVVFGVVASAALQLVVARMSFPSGRSAANADAFASAMLRALALGAVIRLFGGVLAVVVVLKSGRVDPLPFLAGFGGTYVVLEIELARALIGLESRMRPR